MKKKKKKKKKEIGREQSTKAGNSTLQLANNAD
jgi:hypothetical protein